MEQLKYCRKCKSFKPLKDFSKNKNNKDGLKEYCKSCVSIASKKYREKNREIINEKKRIAYYKSKQNAEERTQKELLLGYKTCTKCKKELPLEYFRVRGNGGFYSTCRKCDNLRNKEYRIKNKEKYKKQHRNSQRTRNKRLKENTRDFNDADWNFCKNFFNNQCAYCGKKDKLTHDHLIPLYKNGKSIPKNIIPVCHTCNNIKSYYDFEEWYKKQSFFTKERYNKIILYQKLARQHRGNLDN